MESEHGGKRRPLNFGTIHRRQSNGLNSAHLAAVDDVGVPAGLRPVAEHEEHQGDHHGQQEALGVKPAAAAIAGPVVVAFATQAAARSRSHGVRTRSTEHPFTGGLVL